MTTEQEQNEHAAEGATAAPVVVDDWESLVDEAADQARAAKATQPKQRRVTYTGRVREALAQDPDMDMPSLIRRVTASMGLQSSGLDAMADDELMQVVTTGRRVLDIRKNIEKRAATEAK